MVKNTDLYQAVLSKVKKLHGDYGIASVKTGIVCKYRMQNAYNLFSIISPL